MEHIKYTKKYFYFTKGFFFFRLWEFEKGACVFGLPSPGSDWVVSPPQMSKCFFPLFLFEILKLMASPWLNGVRRTGECATGGVQKMQKNEVDFCGPTKCQEK